jgi:hypothetical protein
MQQPRTIVFEGRTYWLPTTNKRYYTADFPRVNGKRVKKQLHHAIWESHNKQTIPKGFVIHHKDHDYTNNSPDNLELMSKSEHARMHTLARLSDPEQRKLMIQALHDNREKAAAWHSTDAGKAHSKNLLEAFWNAREQVTEECQHCGQPFLTYFPTRALYCSNKCNQAYKAASGYYKTAEATCAYCKKMFIANKHRIPTCCGYSCAAKYRRLQTG